MNRDPQSYAVIGAAMVVHRQMGAGFFEVVYQEALALEFALRGIPFEREVPVPVFYKGQILKTFYKADFICYGELLIEAKALSELPSSAEGQAINYLKATGLKRALLLNFGAETLQSKRVVLNYHPEAADFSADLRR